MEKKTTEENLEKTVHYLDSILLEAPVGMAILELPDFRYVQINKNLAAINSLSVEEHIGKTISELLPEASGNIVPRLQMVVDTGETADKFQFKTNLPKTGSKDRWFEDTFFPIKGDDGTVEAVGVIVEEITEEKRLELDLQEKVNELEAINKMMMGRESRIINLKEQVEYLEGEIKKG